MSWLKLLTFILFTDNGSYRPDTADIEVQMIQRGGVPARNVSPALTQGDYGAPDSSRSTLQGYAKKFNSFKQGTCMLGTYWI